MLTNLFRSSEQITVSHNTVRLSSTPRFMMTVITFTLAVGMTLCLSTNALAQHYQQTNLVSDVPGMAATTDPNLVNPWGLTRSSTSPWWVADNGTGVSTLYNGSGGIIPLVVTIPVPPGGTPPSAPTGTVFNGSSDFFGDHFIFVTEEGTISGWSSGTSAVLRVNNSGSAIYKGVTLAQINGANRLYAANFFAGRVDVFNGTYMPVNLGAGAFSDPSLPTGYAPFNVQAAGGMIFVTFAQQDADKEDEVDGPGLGFVDAFDSAGHLLLRLQSGPWMNAPWGVVIPPANFSGPGAGLGGSIGISNEILIGQFGGGQIARFSLKDGSFAGFLLDVNNQPITIDGLWALGFGNGGTAGPTNTLYFTAGIDDENHGLFGTITQVP
jgi:uncharacterized protein (TIGR03118 family)